MADPEITVCDTIPEHIASMAVSMAEVSANAAVKTGLTPKKALWASYRQSLMCMTAMIEGRVVAMWGVSGTMFSGVGQPWLILAPEIEAYPFRVAFRYRRELDRFQKIFPCLEGYVEKDNLKTIRLLELMGFKVSKNEIPLGEAVFRRAERRVS